MRPNRNTRATLRWSTGMAAAPAAVLSTVGHSAVTKITYTDALPGLSMTTSQMGNHARGDTGRSSWTTGLAACHALRLAPINSPSGMPTRAAMVKPVNTRWREMRSWRPMPLSLGPLS